MRCVECGELLPLYVGGELDENLSSEVKLHVGSCFDCAAELRALQQAWNAFAAAPLPDVRSDFVTRVLVKTLGRQKPSPLVRWRAAVSQLSGVLSSGRRRAVLAGALVVLFIGSVATLTLRTTPSREWQRTLEVMRNVRSAHFVGLYRHYNTKPPERTDFITHIEGWFKAPNKFRWDVWDDRGHQRRFVSDGQQTYVVDFSARCIAPAGFASPVPGHLQDILFGQRPRGGDRRIDEFFPSWPPEEILPERVVQAEARSSVYRNAPARMLRFLMRLPAYHVRWELYLDPATRRVRGLRYFSSHRRNNVIAADVVINRVKYDAPLSDDLFTPGVTSPFSFDLRTEEGRREHQLYKIQFDIMRVCPSPDDTVARRRIGLLLPPTVLWTRKGQPFPIKTAPEKPLLLYFWSNQHKYKSSVRGLDALEIIHRELSPQGLTVLGVNVDLNPAPVPTLWNKQGLTFPCLHDPKMEVFRKWGWRLPKAVVVDGKGIVRAVLKGTPSVEAWRKELAKVMGVSQGKKSAEADSGRIPPASSRMVSRHRVLPGG
ncbi:MAG: redoxin domain-containing protein [Abditibacteriales bacterium]|nr:redoxin domain-containing protein [Abditibacteriales bacterium]MDW8364720.1 redoxin domain-containing protein [Abditibacteriales bacterium]